jgi:hypothetical protein
VASKINDKSTKLMLLKRKYVQKNAK